MSMPMLTFRWSLDLNFLVLAVCAPAALPKLSTAVLETVTFPVIFAVPVPLANFKIDALFTFIFPTHLKLLHHSLILLNLLNQFHQ